MNIGLVFSGGGGKGAYQIGVWKALQEFGVDEHVQAVAGTSVGALNMALFAQGDYRLAEQVWLNISHSDILSLDYEHWFKELSTLIVPDVLPKNISELLPNVMKFLGSKAFLLKAYTFLNERGIWSRAGLIRLIREHLDLPKIAASRLQLFAACTDVTDIPKAARLAVALTNYALGNPISLTKTAYLKLNDLAAHHIEKTLLASSAIPMVFPPEEVARRFFYDGGLSDNDPILPMYRANCDLIIVVQLDSLTILHKERFPNAQIIEVIPHDDQGGLISGTFDFSSEGARRRIEQGYVDARRILEPIFRGEVIHRHFEEGLTQIGKEEREFQSEHQRLLDERRALKEILKEV